MGWLRASAMFRSNKPTHEGEIMLRIHSRLRANAGGSDLRKQLALALCASVVVLLALCSTAFASATTSLTLSSPTAGNATETDIAFGLESQGTQVVTDAALALPTSLNFNWGALDW